jgi:hypothetical protein
VGNEYYCSFADLPRSFTKKQDSVVTVLDHSQIL